MKLTERQKNCPYCHEPYKTNYDTDVPVSLECDDDGTIQPYLIIDYSDPENGDLAYTRGNVGISYCPFCGRKL